MDQCNPFQTPSENQGVSHAQDDPLGVLRNAKDLARGVTWQHPSGFEG